MIQRGKLVFIVIISILATIVAGVNIKQAVERQMDKNSLVDDGTINKIEIHDIEIERHPEKTEMAETNGKDVYTDMGNEEVPEEEKVDLPEKTTINENDGGSWTLDGVDTGEPDLPSEEDNAWFDNLIDQNGTVLH